jgi:hypothetical protein
MLGEIAISELDRLRENLISRRAAGEAVDIEAELLPVLKEAAAFLVGALEVQPNLPAVKLTLASLYLQLAEIAPATINSRADADKLRRAYLSKARDLALELMGSVRKLAERTTLTEGRHARGNRGHAHAPRASTFTPLPVTRWAILRPRARRWKNTCASCAAPMRANISPPPKCSTNTAAARRRPLPP